MTQTEKIMAALGVSREEAAEILADDRRIDKGEKLFELTSDQKATEKAMRQADSKPRDRPMKREKIVDPVKEIIISLLIGKLTEQSMVDNVKVVNNEREFLFTWDDRKFKITLSCPRN